MKQLFGNIGVTIETIKGLYAFGIGCKNNKHERLVFIYILYWYFAVGVLK